MRDLNAKKSHLTTTLPANCPTSTSDKTLQHIDNINSRSHYFCIKSKSMSGLKRFQLTSSSNKRPADEFPSHPKQLSEVAKFNAPGIFFVRAKPTPMSLGGEFTTMDWIAAAILVDKKNEADNEDGEIIELDNEYRRIYSVNLDLDNVRRNPGLRFISKLMLNSLWGKFGMRNEIGANKVLTRPQEFFSLIMDHKIEVSAVIPLSDTAVRVMYKSKKNFVSEHTSSNIVISLWTTSRARLKLLDFMTQIDRTEGAKLLYTDTDSVAVLHKRDIVPIQTGEYLGQMSEEYLDYEIKTFVCGGAKQYGFRMLNKRTGEVEYVQKIRGITFDVNNSKALQFEHFLQKVKNYGRNTGDDNDDAPAVFFYDKIMPTRDSRVITRFLFWRHVTIQWEKNRGGDHHQTEQHMEGLGTLT
ncbi:hypothetical protein niasHT_038394 [Heterodera trifolii]|uniref:DNA-directed DNA polymerase n=1 Tax=Heterodera trifolii TaxID=157864 RepID=A0ABD2HYI4_9BILA